MHDWFFSRIRSDECITKLLDSIVTGEEYPRQDFWPSFLRVFGIDEASICLITGVIRRPLK